MVPLVVAVATTLLENHPVPGIGFPYPLLTYST
jgi:hypothetical protein